MSCYSSYFVVCARRSQGAIDATVAGPAHNILSWVDAFRPHLSKLISFTKPLLQVDAFRPRLPKLIFLFFITGGCVPSGRAPNSFSLLNLYFKWTCSVRVCTKLMSFMTFLLRMDTRCPGLPKLMLLPIFTTGGYVPSSSAQAHFLY